MSAKIAQKLVETGLRQLKKTPKSTTPLTRGSKPSFGQALEGRGEFKVYNLSLPKLAESAFRSQVSRLRDTPQEETGLSKKAEQMLSSHEEGIRNRSKNRLDYRKAFRDSYGRKGPRTASTSREKDKDKERDRGKPTTTVPTMPDNNTKPDEPTTPDFPFGWPDRTTIDTPESEDVYPTDTPDDEGHEPEEWKTGIYSCEAAEEDAASLGFDVKFCPRVGRTISIRALLRGS